MITYNLACAKGHEFEGWFKDSAAYDVQEADGSLACPLCGNGRLSLKLGRFGAFRSAS